jgi:hypothetical protein
MPYVLATEIDLKQPDTLGSPIGPSPCVEPALTASSPSGTPAFHTLRFYDFIDFAKIQFDDLRLNLLPR